MRSLSIVIAGALFTACSPYSPELGVAPFLCAAEEPRCPENYTCQDDGTGRMVCLSENGGVIIDAPMVGPACADDSLIEGMTRNDTIQSAYATPVAGSRKEITLSGLALCPEGDKDTYQVTILEMMGQNLTATTQWESGKPVEVSILGSGGAVLKAGIEDGERGRKAYIATLPQGTYYVQVSAQATVRNNYRLTIKVDP